MAIASCNGGAKKGLIFPAAWVPVYYFSNASEQIGNHYIEIIYYLSILNKKSIIR